MLTIPNTLADVRHCVDGTTVYPAYRVTDHGFNPYPVLEALAGQVADPERALTVAYETHRERWWAMAQDLATELWGPEAQVYALGRGEGWCAVGGIGVAFEDWTEADLSLWEAYGADLYQEYMYLTDTEGLLETALAQDEARTS